MNDSFQQIPENFFALIVSGKIDHQEFFILAQFYKLMEYRKKKTVLLKLQYISERTAIPVRTLVRKLNDLIGKKIVLRQKSDLVGAAGHAVNEYVINWAQVEQLAG